MNQEEKNTEEIVAPFVESNDSIDYATTIGLDDISEDALNGEKVDRKIDLIGCYILRESKAIDGICLSSSMIKEKYNALRKEHPEVAIISLNTLSTTLSKIAKHASCAICCPGKKHGYYLATKIEDIAEPQIEPMIEGAEVSKEEKLWEKHLYPLITAYLSADEDMEWVKNMASSRKNHEWGNTDILGLKLHTFLGEERFELHAYEVKLSMKSWRKDIFEAVSHSLIANRTYFTFVHVLDGKDIPEEMIYYAQKFKIGLLALEIEKGDWNKIVNNPQAIDEEMFDYNTVVPAPYQDCNDHIQSDYFNLLGIHNISELRKFGEK